MRVDKQVHVSVYRKPNHMDRYLDYNSHHPIQHKRSVVNTLFDRATKIPSTTVIEVDAVNMITSLTFSKKITTCQLSSRIAESEDH